MKRTIRHVMLICMTVLSGIWAASGPGRNAAAVRAQEDMVWSSSVQGVLSGQFQRHVLTVEVFDPRQPLHLTLLYTPQNRWELDERMGFFVFNDEGFAAYQAGALPGAVAAAAGAPLPGPERRLQATLQPPMQHRFHLVVYNDSPVPMGYTLTADNGEIIDESGRQVTDRWQIPFSGIPEGVDPNTPYVVVPPPPPPPPTPEPAQRVEGVALRGLLERRYDVDVYELIALDVRQPLTVEMIYDPPEQLRLDESFNFYIFNENQLRDMRAGFLHPVRAPNTAAGHRVQEGDQTVWRAVIAQPVYRYTVLVTQDWYARSVEYRLTVQNGVLTDPSGQAQVLVGPPRQLPFQGQTYTVQPGDTLSRIAQRVYGDKYLYLALCRYNNLANCSLLQPGQRLTLPPRSALPVVSPTFPTPVPLTKLEPTPTPTPGPPLEDNVLEVVARTPDLQILALILDPVESFTALLAGDGPFTVLAPTDAAFNELETAQFEALLDIENPPLTLLQGHVLRGRLTTSRITGVKHFRTLNGSLVRFERQEDGSLTVNGAPVDEEGLAGTNGVVYRIGKVLGISNE